VIKSSDGWHTQINVQNAGEAYTQVVIDFYAASGGECPANPDTVLKTLCSIFLPPGRTWVFNHNDIPEQAVSAIIYSVSPDLVPESCQPATRIPSGQPLAVTVYRQPPTGLGNTYTGFNISDTHTSSGLFTYLLPALSLDTTGWTTTLAAQNAGTACSQIETSYLPATQDHQIHRAESRTVAPGQSAIVSLVSGDGSTSNGSVLITANQPLAIIADQLKPGMGAFVSTSALAVSSSSHRSGAPLLYTPDLESAVLVQNTSADLAAEVQVSFLDASAQVLSQADLLIEPHQFGTFPVPAGTGVGAVRVESVNGYSRTQALHTATTAPPVLTLVDLNRATKGTGLRYAGSALENESQNIALPSLVKNSARTSHIIVHNTNPSPGLTEIRLTLYGPGNNILTRRFALASSQTGMLDLAQIAELPEGWFGSGFIRVGRSGQSGPPSLRAIVVEIDTTLTGEPVSVYPGIAWPEAVAQTPRSSRIFLPLLQRNLTHHRVAQIDALSRYFYHTIARHLPESAPSLENPMPENIWKDWK